MHQRPQRPDLLPLAALALSGLLSVALFGPAAATAFRSAEAAFRVDRSGSAAEGVTIEGERNVRVAPLTGEEGPVMVEVSRAPASRPAGVAFELTSVESGFSVVGSYAGRLWLDDGNVVVRIEHGRIGVTEKARRTVLEGLRVGLARETAGSWTTSWRSPLHYLGGAPALEMDGAEIGPVELVIPGVWPSDLEGHWLVVEHVLTGLPRSPGDRSHPAWTYAHSDGRPVAALMTNPGG